MKQVTGENVRRLAWQAGFDGLNGLAKAIGRNRITVWRAAKLQTGPTYELIIKALIHENIQNHRS